MESCLHEDLALSQLNYFLRTCDAKGGLAHDEAITKTLDMNRTPRLVGRRACPGEISDGPLHRGRGKPSALRLAELDRNPLAVTPFLRFDSKSSGRRLGFKKTRHV
jgi:hypothetical protein